MLELLATLVVLGIVFYLVTLIPMGEPFPQIIRVIAILLAVILVLNFLGFPLFGDLNLR